MQIGDISVIASATGIDTIGDFRPADVAAGGQGAPLVPMADYALFRSETHTRIMLNIGGIANITLLPAGCGPEHVRAFDTGPGNMLMDALVSLDATAGLRYDVDGAMAARGCVSQPLLDEMLQVKSASLLFCFFQVESFSSCRAVFHRFTVFSFDRGSTPSTHGHPPNQLVGMNLVSRIYRLSRPGIQPSALMIFSPHCAI